MEFGDFCGAEDMVEGRGRSLWVGGVGNNGPLEVAGLGFLALLAASCSLARAWAC